MALTYTGRADVLVVDGREYHPGDKVPISKARAAQLSATSRLHTFEDADGKDVLDAATAPAASEPTPKRS